MASTKRKSNSSKKVDQDQQTSGEPQQAPSEPQQAPSEPQQAPSEPQAPEAPTMFAWSAPDTFEPLPQDFLIYSPSRCDGRSILGIPVDVIDLPREKSTIKALVIMLLEPTVVVDAIGNSVEARIGQEVLVECGHFLRRLIRAAIDPNNVGEIWMRPVGRLPSEGGDGITLWDIRYGKVFPREKIKRTK